MKRIALLIITTIWCQSNVAGLRAAQANARGITTAHNVVIAAIEDKGVPANQLSIIQVQANPNQAMTITGRNFANGTPQVILDGNALKISSISDTEIIAQLRSGMRPGVYLLTVITGWASTQFDAVNVTIGVNGSMESQVLDGPVRAATAGELRIQGLKEYRGGHFSEAERLLQSALQLAGEEGDTYGVALAYEGLGDIYQNSFNFVRAEQLYRNASAILRSQPEHAFALAMTLRNLAAALSGQMRLREALTTFAEASTVIKAGHINDPQLKLQIVNGIGVIYFRQGELKKAERVFIRAANMKPDGKALPLDAADALNNLGTIYAHNGNMKKAFDCFARAFELTAARLGAGHPNLSILLDNIGFLHLEIKDYAEAEKHFLGSMRILENSDALQTDMGLRTLQGLGQTYLEEGQNEKAASFLTRAIEIGRQIGAENPSMAETLETYSKLLRSVAKESEADKLHIEAARLRAQMTWTTHVGTK